MANEKTPIIQKTYDYDKFKFLKENRPVNKFKVAKIAKSIEENDQTAYRPVLVDANFGIIDGQHQFSAQVKLKRPIYYVQNPDAVLRTIVLLNAFTTNWGIKDYADYYAKLKKEAYIKTIKFADAYHVSISLAFGMLSMTFHGMGRISDDFKAGMFVITHEKEATQLMDEIMEVRSQLVGNVIGNREFYRSYTIMRQQVDFETFKHTVLGKRLKIETRGSKKEYLRQFEDILNYEKSKNLIRLF